MILGLGLSLAPIGSYLAVTGRFDLIPVLFSFTVLFWVSGFDIIYSLQDEEFDKEKKEEIVPTEEEKKELENLLKAIKDLEENKNKEKDNKKKGFIAIEFGGVFHHNLYINLVFTYILNLTLAFIIIQIFNFASYDNIIYVALFILGYTIVESIFRLYVLMNHFQLIVKSLGFVFFFGYVFIFFTLDQYIFG